MSHFGVFYPRGGGRYLIEIIYSIHLISRFRLGKKIPIIYKKLEAGSWKLASLRSWGFSRKSTTVCGFWKPLRSGMGFKHLTAFGVQ
jgi:hypothetical protein